MAQTYCDFVAALDARSHSAHKHYHDNEYGFPLTTDAELFGRLILEINQAGLSWTTILNKKDNFYKAYKNYDIAQIALFEEKDIAELMSDAGIIRNRRKIEAAIHNARVILQLQESHGAFLNWLHSHHPLSREEWVRLFKKTFRFTGGEITGEFLMSTGFLPGAHAPDCPVFTKIRAVEPAWMATIHKGEKTAGK